MKEKIPVSQKKRLIISLEVKDHCFIKKRAAELGISMQEYILQALLEKITRDLQYQ